MKSNVRWCISLTLSLCATLTTVQPGSRSRISAYIRPSLSESSADVDSSSHVSRCRAVSGRFMPSTGSAYQVTASRRGVGPVLVSRSRETLTASSSGTSCSSSIETVPAVCS